MPVSPVLRQDCEFEDSLDYIEDPVSKKKKRKEKLVWKNYYLFLFIGRTGFEIAKQVLYHLSHTSSPFCSGYFGDGIS
jgi:hypothetical protein